MIRQLVQVRPAHPEVASIRSVPSAHDMSSPGVGRLVTSIGEPGPFAGRYCGDTAYLSEEKKRKKHPNLEDQKRRCRQKNVEGGMLVKRADILEEPSQSLLRRWLITYSKQAMIACACGAVKTTEMETLVGSRLSSNTLVKH
jgi:hypothetical protein